MIRDEATLPSRKNRQPGVRWCGTRGLAASRRSAFTLIELLVVISIIALLLGLMMPALASARDSALTIVCMSRLNQIHTASVSYGVDYTAIPSGRSYENEYSRPQPVARPPSWYFALSREWTRGPAFTTQTMAAGYLPPDKNVAWCPAKDYNETGSTDFWNLPIDDQFWGLSGSPYGANGYRFNSTVTTGGEQYLCGGAIPQWKWDQYPSAFFITEVGGTSNITTSAFLDPGGAAPTRPARHNGKLTVIFAGGHAEVMDRELMRVLINASDPQFVWGN